MMSLENPGKIYVITDDDQSELNQVISTPILSKKISAPPATPASTRSVRRMNNVSDDSRGFSPTASSGPSTSNRLSPVITKLKNGSETMPNPQTQASLTTVGSLGLARRNSEDSIRPSGHIQRMYSSQKLFNIESSNESFELILSSKSCANSLMLFLRSNPDPAEDDAVLITFSEMTKKALLRTQITDESRLYETLVEQGWDSHLGKYIVSDKDLFRISLQAKLQQLYAIYSHEISKYNISNKGNLIKSFCPTLLLESLLELAKSRNQLLTPHKIDFTGVCMLADISGFTALAAQYSAGGREGLGKLHETTKFFLGQFVELVYSYEGDVIAFAGDALICTFVNRYEDARLCCLDALRCADELKELKDENLSVHIALSYGEMSMGRLGGHNDSWIYLLNGPCLSEIKDCIHDAHSKEVVMSAYMYDLILPELFGQEVLEVEETDTHNKKLVKLQVRDTFKSKFNRFEAFQDAGIFIEFSELFVPKPAKEQLALFKEIGEVRTVTTMFLNLDSYSETEHLDPLSLQPFFLMAQQELAENGGFMRQFLIDDKGCVLIGMWGVPTFMHADNSIMALKCAAAILSKSMALDHKCSIGITTGNVYCGTVGSVLRHDYVGIGGTVNLAARLMCKAKGKILLDHTSFDLLSKECKDMLPNTEHHKVKGYDDAVLSHVYSGGEINIDLVAKDIDSFDVVRKAVAESLSSFLLSFNPINRSVPYLDNAAHIFASQQSRTHMENQSNVEVCTESHTMCIIEGESGMGRSNAAKFFRSTARKLRMNCIHISARHDDESASYGIFKKLFFELVGSRFKTEQQQKDVLSKLVRDLIPPQEQSRRFNETFMSMKNFLKLNWSTDTETIRNQMSMSNMPEMVVEELISNFEWIVHKLLNEMKPVVVIEDAQFCDELTWKAIGRILDCKVNVLVLLTVHVDQSHSKPKYAAMSNKLASSTIVTVGATFNVTNETELKQQVLHSETYLKLTENPLCKTIVLTALTGTDISSILESILDKELVTEDLVKTVCQISSGNPYWITNIAEFIREKGSVAFQDAILARDSNNPLRSLILCRLDSLSPQVVHVAKIASILNDEFTEEFISRLLPGTRDLNDHLLTLRQNGFLELTTNTDPAMYDFQNPLLRLVVYGLIPNQVTSEFHSKIASLIEEMFSANLAPYFSRLYFHYAHVTGGRVKAFYFAMKSADWAIRHAAYVEGRVHIEQAKTMANNKIELKSLLKLVDAALTEMTKARNTINFLFAGRNLKTDPEIDAYKAINEELGNRLKEIMATTGMPVNSPPADSTATPPRAEPNGAGPIRATNVTSIENYNAAQSPKPRNIAEAAEDEGTAAVLSNSLRRKSPPSTKKEKKISGLCSVS